MCYHNSINTDKQHLERKYKKKLVEAPTLFEPIFHASGFQYPYWPLVLDQDNIEMCTWGLIPYWTRSPKEASEIKARTLNARIETLSEKPSFKNGKPCIIPSTGFFEWQTVGTQKIPYYITCTHNEIFSLAGIYDEWVNEKGILQKTFSILTTEANSLMRTIHNTKHRMPVILKDSQEDDYVTGKLNKIELQIPFESNLMKAHTISNTILSKNHNTLDVMKPQTVQVQEQLGLF